MEDLAWLRDEVNEPLGFFPVPEQRPVVGAGWKVLPLVVPALVAVAMAAFTYGRYDASRSLESLAARTEPPPAPARAEPTRSQEPVAVDKLAPTPIATADQVEAASVKVMPQGGGAAPTPLIIDVQQALAAARARARPVVQR
jgi:hypothetical protein